MKCLLLWSVLVGLLFAAAVLAFLFRGYRLPSRRRPLARAPPTFLCLTSTPARLAEPWIQQNILRMQQLEGVSGVVAALPWALKKTGEAYVVPPAFLAAPNLRVLRCEDEGPATKLLAPLGSAALAEDHILIVVDDDMQYKSDAFVDLVAAVEREPGAVHAMCQRKVLGFLGYGAYKKTFLPLLGIARPAACERVDDDFFGAALERLGVPVKRVAVEGCLSFCEACAFDLPQAARRFVTDRKSLAWEDTLATNNRRKSVKRCLEALDRDAAPSGL